MKPYPIPVLEGEAAEEFIQMLEKGPTPLQKEIMEKIAARCNAKSEKKKKK